VRYKDLGELDKGNRTGQGPQGPPPPPASQAGPQECPKIISAAHKQQILSANKFVVIDIYGDWCGPCKVVAPRFYELAHKYTRAGLCAMVKEDVDDELTPDVQGVPAFDFFVDGKRVHRITGGAMDDVEAKLMELAHAGQQSQQQSQQKPQQHLQQQYQHNHPRE